MTKNSSEQKEQKRQARLSKDQAQSAFGAGDYQLTREHNSKIVELVPESELAKQATQMNENFKLEPWTFRVAIIALLLLGSAWIIVLI